MSFRCAVTETGYAHEGDKICFVCWRCSFHCKCEKPRVVDPYGAPILLQPDEDWKPKPLEPEPGPRYEDIKLDDYEPHPDEFDPFS